MNDKTILIVDDNYDDIRFLEDNLKKHGYKVLTSINSLNAIGLFSTVSPNLIILNYSIDKYINFEFLKNVSNNNLSKMSPIIYLSDKEINHEIYFNNDNVLEVYYKPINQSLISKINGYFSRLEKLKKKFDDKLQKLSQSLTQALPHEFRTSINSIFGYSNEIKYFLQSRNFLHREEINEVLQMNNTILKSVQYLHRLSENFILYSELQASTLFPEKFNSFKKSFINNPKEIIIDVIHSIGIEETRKKDIYIEVVDANLRINFYHFHKIVYELIDNSIKFSDVGDKIQIFSYKDKTYYTLIIIDNGRGMTAEQIENIDIYHQFEREKYEQQGTGLGLSIAKVLVNFYDGDFEIKRNEIKGLTIKIKLNLF